MDDKDKKNLYKRFDSFAKEFSQLKNLFLTASNTGLNLTFIVHEVDKILDHLEEVIRQKDLNKIGKVFSHLQNTIDAYKNMIRLDKKKSTLALKSIIDQSIFNSQYRFECHKIKLVKDWDNKFEISGKKGLIIGIINNLFDNSIYWLNTYQIAEKKILIKTYQEEDFSVILIADNGKGFNISFESALGPFISGRSEESSMGIGLYLASQIMEAHGGNIEQGEQKEDKLPPEFADGAIIKLKFKKEI